MAEVAEVVEVVELVEMLEQEKEQHHHLQLVVEVEEVVLEWEQPLVLVVDLYYRQKVSRQILVQFALSCNHRHPQ